MALQFVSDGIEYTSTHTHALWLWGGWERCSERRVGHEATHNFIVFFFLYRPYISVPFAFGLRLRHSGLYLRIIRS